jgi:hypothetical protein
MYAFFVVRIHATDSANHKNLQVCLLSISITNLTRAVAGFCLPSGPTVILLSP